MTDERLDALFTLSVDEFTEARDSLARELRAAGDKEAASSVRRLRRPTLAAWAVNQAVRADPEAYERLRQAGQDLHRAMRRAMSGVGDADVGSASRDRRQQVRSMTDRAAAHLADAGHDADSHREAIAATFEAASADEDAGDEVGRGQLSRPLPAPSGFGELSPLAVAAALDEEPADAEPTAAERTAAPDEEVQQAVEAARQRAEHASDAADRARREAQEATARAETSEARAQDAEAEAQRARRAATQARREADDHRRTAERRARQAEEDHAVAERRAEELRDAETRLAQGH